METRANNTTNGPGNSWKTHHKRSWKLVQITPQKVLEYHGKHHKRSWKLVEITPQKILEYRGKHHKRSWKLVEITPQKVLEYRGKHHKRSWKLVEITPQKVLVCCWKPPEMCCSNPVNSRYRCLSDTIPKIRGAMCSILSAFLVHYNAYVYMYVYV